MLPGLFSCGILYPIICFPVWDTQVSDLILNSVEVAFPIKSFWPALILESFDEATN